MKETSIFRSPDIPLNDLDEITEALGSLGMNVENYEHLTRSHVDGPTFVQIMADVLVWVTPLKVAATIFLTEIAKLAAQDLWKNKKAISSAFGSAATTPLRKIVRAISALSRRMPSESSLVVGLPVPDEYFGTIVDIRRPDEVEAAVVLATFIKRAEAIQSYVAKLATSEFKPVGPVIINLKEDGRVILRWMDRKELKDREADLTEGQPVKRNGDRTI